MNQPTLGESLRDDGVALVDAVELTEWQDRADAAIRYLAGYGIEFTAETIRAAVGDPEHSNSMGSRFLKASKAGLIERVGYRKPSRPSRHANQISVWRGVR